MTQRPAPLRTDGSNPFAHITMRQRLPSLIRETLTLNPDYPEGVVAALEGLIAAVENDAPIPPLADTPLPDLETWRAAYAAHPGDTWLNTDWLYGETMLYRQVIELVGWPTTRRDPYAPKKRQELQSDAMYRAVGRALSDRIELADAPANERLSTLTAHALWGNRIDLSYAVSMSHGHNIASDDLLADDREALNAYLLSRDNHDAPIHFITDNAGTELAADLILTDALLDGFTDQVVLNLKAFPTYVSDATIDDARAQIQQLAEYPRASNGREVGERLQSALMDGRLVLRSDPFWNSPHFVFEMPAHIREMLSEAALVISKGDANYRRFVGDALWPAETPLADVLGYFPAPLLLLRSMKSDPVIGLAGGVAERMDRVDEAWRVNGRRGLIQFYQPGR